MGPSVRVGTGRFGGGVSKPGQFRVSSLSRVPFWWLFLLAVDGLVGADLRHELKRCPSKVRKGDTFKRDRCKGRSCGVDSDSPFFVPRNMGLLVPYKSKDPVKPGCLPP